MKKWNSRPVLYSGVLFVLLVISLILLYNSSMWVHSTIRAYVSSEDYYSKAQKDAVISLLNYNEYRRESDFKRYKEHISIPLGDQIARKTLRSDNPDRALAYRGFIQGDNSPEDVPAMITFFLRFKNEAHFVEARAQWAAADSLVNEVVLLANQLHERIGSGQADEKYLQNWQAKLLELNDKLTILESEFSMTLGEAARWLKSLLQWVTILAILLLVGLALLIFYKVVHNIRRSQQMYVDLFRQTRDTVFIMTPDGTLLDVNPAGLKLFGYSTFKEMETEFNIEDIVESEEKLAEMWERLRSKGSISVHELNLRKKDGSLLHARVTAHVSRETEGGKVTDIKGIVRDLTKQKKLEERLFFRAAIFNKIVQISSDAVILINTQSGEIMQSNDAALKLFEVDTMETLKNKFHPSTGKTTLVDRDSEGVKEALLKHSF